MCCEDRECRVRASVFGHLFTEWSQGLKEESDVHYFWIKKKSSFCQMDVLRELILNPLDENENPNLTLALHE